MAHDHSHHHHPKDSGKNLKIAFFLNLGFTILEIFGGLYVNSISIISDALHDLGDSVSLGISWFLQHRSKKEATAKFTFGYKRFSLLGALINSTILIAGSIFIIIEAISRIIHPQSSNAQGMFIFALIGIAVNGYAAFRLSGGKTLNERVVSWHLIEDVLGWTAVLIASIVLMFKNIPIIDPILSLLITIYILYNVIGRLKETLMLFLQGVPNDIDPEKIRVEILAVPKVISLHQTHIWSLEGENHVYSSHVKLSYIQSIREILEVKNNIKAILKHYPFSHYTIEIELQEDTCDLDGSKQKEHLH